MTECAAFFEAEVTLTATAESGSEFVEWEECPGAVGDVCKITVAELEEEPIVVAIFAPEPELVVEVEGGGEGTISSTPTGIEACSEAGGPPCSAHFKNGTVVTLTPTVEPGSEFIEWEGCPKHKGADECEVTMTEEEQEVTAVIYTEPELTVEVEGGGEGTVSSTPTGIDACGYGSGACYARFPGESTVALTPSAEPGSEFVKWGGCTTEVGEECKVAMVRGEEEEQEVTAEFALYPELEVEVEGEGTVSSFSHGHRNLRRIRRLRLPRTLRGRRPGHAHAERGTGL